MGNIKDMAKEKTLRQGFNEVTIEGVLQEIKINEYNNDGKKSLSGKILIQKEEGSIHEISVYQNEKTKDGKDNAIYKGLETIKNEYKSIAAVGKEEADLVRATQAELNTNDYVGQDGKLRSFTKTKANFINRVQTVDNYEPKANFDVELFITKISKEISREGEETGRLIVEGVVPVYGGKVSPQTFIAVGEGAEFIDSEYEKGQTVRIYGDIINNVEITRTEVAAAFGKPKVTIKEKFIREFLILGGEEPYDEEDVKSFSPELIKAALVEREAYLEELLNKNNQKDKGRTETKRSGFGKKKEEPKVNNFEVEEDDLPF